MVGGPIQLRTLAEFTSVVAVVTRDAISSWNGVAMLRQSTKRRDEQNPGREMPVARCNKQARPKARDTASDTTGDVGVAEST
jgi:hypothetical protein